MSVTVTTKDVEIRGPRCQFLERMEHGGWTRCHKMADGVHYIHTVRNDEFEGFHFCKEHAHYSYIAMAWHEFLRKGWLDDPYAKYWIDDTV